MTAFSRILSTLTWGVAAGLAALAVDELLALVTLGFAIPVSGPYLAAYAAAGALAAALAETVRALVGAPVNFHATGAVTFALLYAVSVFERFEHAFAHAGVSGTLLFAGVAAALAGYAAWMAVLSLILSGSVTGAASQAMLLAASGVAVGLALNRNVIAEPSEPAALALDAAVVLGSLLAALAARIFGPKRTWTALGAATVALIVGLTLSGPPEGSSPTARRPPHLILVVIDTLRQDVFQSVVEETEEGRAFREAVGGAAWFDNAIAAAPWTPPSVASILTGLYPSEHGFGSTGLTEGSRPLSRLPDSVATLAEHLRGQGYRTLGIMSNPLLHPVSGIAQGFDHYEILESSIAKLPLLTALGRAGLLDRNVYQPASAVRRRLAQGLGQLAADASPVFLWLHLMDPHQPLHPHRDLAADPGARSLPPEEQLYRGEIRYCLRELTRMIALLDQEGFWDDSVFALVADHGEMFPSDGHHSLPPGSPLTQGHGHALFGELVRVPLVLRPAGGLPSARQVSVLASHTDLHDTFADLLGVDIPRIGRDRVSLAPWVAPDPSEEKPRRRTVALMEGIHRGPRQRAARTEKYKLIRYPDGELPDELYEIVSDPGETRDVAAAEPSGLAAIREQADLFFSLLGPAPESGLPPELDAETIRRMKALGYLD